MLRVDHEICEHDVDHVFVFPQTSRQRGVHTSRVCRVYLSLRSRPHLFCDSEVSYETSEDEILFESECEIAPDGAFTGPIQEE